MRQGPWLLLTILLASAGAVAARAAAPPRSAEPRPLAAAEAEPADLAAALRPAPRDPEAAAGLRLWYRGFAPAVAPVARRWRELAAADRSGPGRRWADSCRELARALARLDRAIVARAPDGALRLHLGRMFERLDGAASACGRGDYFLAGHRLDRATAAWRQAHSRLRATGALP